MNSLDAALAENIAHIKSKHLFRRLLPQKGIDFSSNDYLGLSNHPRIRAHLIDALNNGIPLGAGGSRLLRGNHQFHEELEHELAGFKKAPAVLILNSGFDANIGMIKTLVGKEGFIFSDAFNHASIIDGIRLSRAPYSIYRHCDLADLETHLRTSTNDRRKFIITESVFSMDGDIAPLMEIRGLAKQYDATLIVDEAHATGVFGERGGGLTEDWDYDDPPLITVHTCGKAWGSFGAFVACSKTIRDYLTNCCRNFIYTTALPPLLMVQWQAALEIIKTEPWRRRRVLQAAQFFREQITPVLNCGNSMSQIVPIILGSSAKAISAAEQLQKLGYDIRAIRYPSVPEGQARLRISIHGNQTEQQLSDLATTLMEII